MQTSLSKKQLSILFLVILTVLLLVFLGALSLTNEEDRITQATPLRQNSTSLPELLMIGSSLTAQILQPTSMSPVSHYLNQVMIKALRENARLRSKNSRIALENFPLAEPASAFSPPQSADFPESSEVFGLPVFIQITSINVNAEIERVALADDGSMDVPKHPFTTAWYELGPRPGEIGSAVIAGHVNWMDGSTAIFADLHKVKTGDKIIVQNNMGDDIPFVVREIRSYEAAQDATDVFTSHDGKAHLNIITCSGVWDKKTQQYTKRLVVFADRAS